MKLLEMADRLGKEVSRSKEYIRLMEAEKQYKEDKKAEKLVKKFKEKQKMLNSSAAEQNNSANEIRKELAKLYHEIEENKVISELNNSLSEFLILKQRVYETIEAPISIDKEILSLNRNCGGCRKNCGGCNNINP